MQNRLAELNIQKDADTQNAQNGDIETGQKKQFMADFFKDVELVKAAIQFVRKQIGHVEELSERASKAIGSNAETAISNELQQLLQITNQRCQATKQKLQEMKSETKRLEEKKEAEPSEIRIRRTLLVTLTQKFKETVRQFQQVQEAYKSTVQAKVTRQVLVVKPSASPDEIKRIVDQGGSREVLRNAILKDGDPVSETYLKVEDKYKDVLALQRSVDELSKLFQDISVLVQTQGELIDSVAAQVAGSKEYIATGNDQLRQASKAQKAVRKKYCCLAIILLVIIVAILSASFL